MDFFPQGYWASGVRAGLYPQPGKRDLGVIYSTVSATAAGIFTKSTIQSAAIAVSKEHLVGGRCRAIVANSGCANTCTGSRGIADAKRMSTSVAHSFGIAAHDVLVASTGVIGTYLPMRKIRSGIASLAAAYAAQDRAQPERFARAIMTTDLRTKISFREITVPGGSARIWGAVKGSGMIHPNMGTMLGFILTDARVSSSAMLRCMLRAAAAETFNAISVDGDTSPNDTVFLLANGASGVGIETAPARRIFVQALTAVCEELASSVVADGEGVRKTCEFIVRDAASRAHALRAARLIATSPLVKTALAGGDPNWGRMVAVVGRSLVTVDPNAVTVLMNGVTVARRGVGVPSQYAAAARLLVRPRNTIEIRLGAGSARARYIGCDMTEGYIKINAHMLT